MYMTKNLSLFSFLICIHILFTHTLIAYQSAPRCTHEAIEEALPYAYLTEHNNDKNLQELQTTIAPDYHIFDFNTSSIPFYPQTSDNFDSLLKGICKGIDFKNQSIQCAGLFVRIYSKSSAQKIIISFQGSETNYDEYLLDTLLNWSSNALQATGSSSIVYELATKLTTIFKNYFHNYEIILTGHSLGAGLAQYAAIMNDCEAYCFNSPALGTNSLEKIQDFLSTNNQTIQDISHKIHHIHIRGDILQDINFLTDIFFDTEKIGSHCAIPPHNSLTQHQKSLLSKLINKIERHQAQHLVESLLTALEN